MYALQMPLRLATLAPYSLHFLTSISCSNLSRHASKVDEFDKHITHTISPHSESLLPQNAIPVIGVANIAPSLRTNRLDGVAGKRPDFLMAVVWEDGVIVESRSRVRKNRVGAVC
jgi:hypothetical protein